MTLKTILYLATTFFFFSTNGFGQDSPPPMAMPSDSSTILVDKIIEVTQHEKYFVDYCTGKVNDYSTKNNWSQEKTAQILESINFKYYKSTIYNSYAFYTTDQLKAMLAAVTSLNDNSIGETMILTNAMMQNNLDGLVKGIIEGKYIRKKPK